MSRVWVPPHVARVVVNYFAYAASAHREARCRLLHLCRASGCLGTSCGSSRDSSSTTSPTPCVRVPRHVARLDVDYFAYVTRLGALALRVARRRLLRPRRVSWCLGTSRGTSLSSSCGSSSTTLPTPRVRVPRLVTWFVARLVVDYFASHRPVVYYFTHIASPGASACRAARR
jgi:hypothetical protein